MAENNGKGKEVELSARRGLPHINFRPFLFCAAGLYLGIMLYFAIRLDRFRLFEFVPLAILFYLSLRPFRLRRLLWLFGCVAVFCGAAAGLAHWACERYLSGMPAGEYAVEGTVERFGLEYGEVTCTLRDVRLNGARVKGKMEITLVDPSVRPGDVLSFRAEVSRYELPRGKQNAYAFANDIRYFADEISEHETLFQKGVFLKLNASIFDLLDETMPRDEASLAYALLTGNSLFMERGLAAAVRNGGIAHAFAVSGLHIGIVYGAVLLLCKPLKRYACLPALAVALAYGALCAFTVSSVRALIMCALAGAYRFAGRKYDFLTSISLAALCILPFSPAQMLTVGFSLSFGACLGMALLSGALCRAFAKIKLPKLLGDYLGTALSVQIFTFPVVVEAFGTFPVWGFLLNFFLLPFLPVLLIALLLCTLFALATTITAVMAVPAGLISALLYALAAVDTSFVLAGFALGTGGAVIVSGCILLSQRVRMKGALRAVAAVACCMLFALVLTAENVVFTGCKIATDSARKGDIALLRTKDEAVLVIDGDCSLNACKNFLNRNYGGKLDAVFVIADDELRAINVAAFLGADKIYAMEEIATGLQNTEVTFAERAAVGDMAFFYERRNKLSVICEGIVVEIDFESVSALGADLFLGNGTSTVYYLKNGAIYKRV